MPGARFDLRARPFGNRVYHSFSLLCGKRSISKLCHPTIRIPREWCRCRLSNCLRDQASASFSRKKPLIKLSKGQKICPQNSDATSTFCKREGTHRRPFNVSATSNRCIKIEKCSCCSKPVHPQKRLLARRRTDMRSTTDLLKIKHIQMSTVRKHLTELPSFQGIPKASV